MDCKKSSNLKDCSCTYEPCPRKGLCCDCVAFHRTKGELPACYFTGAEKGTRDRSAENYIRTTKK